jgi:hypothetical protein
MKFQFLLFSATFCLSFITALPRERPEEDREAAAAHTMARQVKRIALCGPNWKATQESRNACFEMSRDGIARYPDTEAADMPGTREEALKMEREQAYIDRRFILDAALDVRQEERKCGRGLAEDNTCIEEERVIRKAARDARDEELTAQCGQESVWRATYITRRACYEKGRHGVTPIVW